MLFYAAINWCQRIVKISQIKQIYSWAIGGTSYFAVDQQLAIYKRAHFHKNCQNINNVADFRLAQYLDHSLPHK